MSFRNGTRGAYHLTEKIGWGAQRHNGKWFTNSLQNAIALPLLEIMADQGILMAFTETAEDFEIKNEILDEEEEIIVFSCLASFAR